MVIDSKPFEDRTQPVECNHRGREGVHDALQEWSVSQQHSRLSPY